MRLVTFNVLHGRSPRDGRVDRQRFVEAVSALDADVLGLQEVDLAQPRSGHLDLTGLAAAALGAREYRFAAAIEGTPGEAFQAAVHGESPPEPVPDSVDGGGPRYGVALVSRLPVLSWRVLSLRPAPVRSPVFAPGPWGPLRLLRDEPRVLLAAVIEGPAGPLTVANTHLSFVPGWNIGQLRRVTRTLRKLPAPRILLGDLNMPPGLARNVSGWRPLARRATFPSFRPRIQLDHVLADGAGLPTVVAVDAPESPVSDHRPLAVDVEWAAQGQPAPARSPRPDGQ